MARLKAASLVHTIELARKVVGDDRLRELIPTLPRETQTLLAREILPSEWIEADHGLPFHQALLYEHFEGDEMSFRAFFRQVCERDFNALSKILMRVMLSPLSLLKRMSKRWSIFSDSGRLDVAVIKHVEVGRRVTLKLSAFKSEHAVFGILLHAFVEQLLHASGARAVEVRRPVNRVVLGEVETELVAKYG